MQTRWQEGDQTKRVVSPLSLIISAFALVGDVRKTWTPELQKATFETDLVFIDLGKRASAFGWFNFV